MQSENFCLDKLKSMYTTSDTNEQLWSLYVVMHFRLFYNLCGIKQDLFICLFSLLYNFIKNSFNVCITIDSNLFFFVLSQVLFAR